MRKNKFIGCLFLVISIMFLNLVNVKAIPTTLGPIDQVGSRVEDSSCPSPSGSCYSMALKINQVNGSIATICTNYNKKTPAAGPATCTITEEWDEKTRYAVAAIIQNANPSISVTGMTAAYFSAELAINEFLYQKGAGGYHIYGTSLSNKYKTHYDSYLSAATTAYNNYDFVSQIPINLSTTNLSFSLNGNNYESNSITVNDVDSYNVETNIGTVSKLGSSFKIIVPTTLINNVTSISVKISASKSLPQARNYSCGTYVDKDDYDEDNNTTETLEYQHITPNVLDSITKSSNKTISGTITPLANLTVNKVDANNQPVVGAKIKITGPNNYSLEYVTDGTSKVLNNLSFGKYVIEEVSAPEGYTISQNKEITLSQTNLNGVVTLTDTKIKTTFSKLDATGKNELPGATLEIQDEKGNIVKLCPGTEGEEKTECKWISTDKPFVIEGLPNGKYYLVETIAPDKYVLNKEKVEFIIDGSKSLVEVKMQNRLNQVKISKLSVATKGELPGATLEIQDEEGIVVKYCKDANGNENKACKWVSTDEAYVIEGMPNGTYYLVETLAPKGYVLNKEKVKFVVDGNKSIVEVEMKNELEVEVPDTLSSRSALLVAISMFDIALGIGILTYVKKNKIEE